MEILSRKSLRNKDCNSRSTSFEKRLQNSRKIKMKISTVLEEVKRKSSGRNESLLRVLLPGMTLWILEISRESRIQSFSKSLWKRKSSRKTQLQFRNPRNQQKTLECKHLELNNKSRPMSLKLQNVEKILTWWTLPLLILYPQSLTQSMNLRCIPWTWVSPSTQCQRRSLSDIQNKSWTQEEINRFTCNNLLFNPCLIKISSKVIITFRLISLLQLLNKWVTKILYPRLPMISLMISSRFHSRFNLNISSCLLHLNPSQLSITPKTNFYKKNLKSCRKCMIVWRKTTQNKRSSTKKP